MNRRLGPEIRRVGGLLLAMGWVGAGFVVMLDAGYHLHRQTPPDGMDALTPASVVILALTTAAGAGLVWRGLPYRTRRRISPALADRMTAERRSLVEARTRRLAILAADPVRATYAVLIERGQAWSDEQIAYDLDPTALATCAHLQPIEAAMRQAGVPVKREVPPNVTARCVLDQAAFDARFTLPSVVRYSEGSYGGRAYEDGLFAMLYCDDHDSRINLTHRHEHRDEPMFPG